MLRFENVSYSYGDVQALQEVSFQLRPGEVFGLLGPNGAGKTTAVSLAVGLLKPQTGTVTIGEGHSPAEPGVRARIGFAPQSLAIYEHLTAEENLLFFGRMAGLRGSQLKKQTAWALDFVGLTPRARDLVSTFSGGMKRRLNLAIAVVHKPPLLLLDEPTVGVDPQSRNAIFDNVRTLADAGCSVLYTTHYMEEAQRLCHTVGILDAGRLLALDSVEGLIRRYGGRPTVVAEGVHGEERFAAEDPVAELARLEKTGRYHRLRIEMPSLEEVFLRLTGRELRD